MPRAAFRRRPAAESRKRLQTFAKFIKTSSDFVLGYRDALDYFTTLASLTGLLNDPSFKAFLAKLDGGGERTVGDLVAFMNAHNLRFGRTTSDRQVEIYSRLLPALESIRDQTLTARITPPPPAPDKSGAGLKSVARQAFKGMAWDQLEAHRKSQ